MEKETALWKKVSEEEKKDILIEAKRIMDKFNDALSVVEKEVKDVQVERDECEREEKETSKSDEEFRKIMLKNAKNKNEDCIIAEKGAWV